jgi:L-ornithine N5-oxygenase
VGIGFGPSNIAFAVALRERGEIDNCVFLEAAEYVKWVAEQFRSHVALSTRVVSIEYSDADALVEIKTNNPEVGTVRARSIVFGTGRSEEIPQMYQGLLGENVVHLKDYLPAKKRWCKRFRKPRVCVLGGSQSAVEIVLDLSSCADVTNVSRSFGFKQKDLSAFTESIYYPDFVNYFYNSGEVSQGAMMSELWRSNYGAADPDVIAELNFKLYEQKVRGGTALEVLRNTLVEAVTELPGDEGYEIRLREKYTGQTRQIEVDGIVLATGYKNFGDGPGQEPYHPLLQALAETHAKYRADGGIEIGRDYRLIFQSRIKSAVYVNGLCEASHGFGDAGSFSLLSVRSYEIAQSLSRFLSEHQRISEMQAIPAE